MFCFTFVFASRFYLHFLFILFFGYSFLKEGKDVSNPYILRSIWFPYKCLLSYRASFSSSFSLHSLLFVCFPGGGFSTHHLTRSSALIYFIRRIHSLFITT